MPSTSSQLVPRQRKPVQSRALTGAMAAAACALPQRIEAAGRTDLGHAVDAPQIQAQFQRCTAHEHVQPPLAEIELVSRAARLSRLP
jgi:hypothetical protein